MRRRYDHVSAERVLSGPGLINLYNVLCELDGIPAASFTAPQITAEQEDVRAKEAKDMFCEMLGTVAGNLALTLGLTPGLALGPHSWPSLLGPHSWALAAGLYIAGDIVPKLRDSICQSNFRRRFGSKAG